MNTTDLKKTANPREQILSLLVLFALFLMFFRVVYFPKRDALHQLKSQVNNLKLEKESLEKFTQALLKIAPQTTGKESRSPKIEILTGDRKPIAQEIPLLLAHLTNPQFLRGVAIKEMSDLPPKKETGFAKASFSLNLQGSFRNVTSYLERLEHLPALLTMDNIALNALDTKASQINLELSGTLYKLDRLEEKHASPTP